MKTFLLAFFVLWSSVSIAQKNTTGYIYNVNLQVDNRIRVYDVVNNETEIYHEQEANELLEMISNIIENKKSIGDVTYAEFGLKPLGKSTFNTLGKDILNQGVLNKSETYHTMEGFPNASLKKAKKVNADEYYEIDMKVKWGGNAGDVIVMNKLKKPAYVKYSIDITVTARNKDKKVLWKKSGSFFDFSDVLDGEVSGKYFKVEGAQTVSIADIDASASKALTMLLK